MNSDCRCCGGRCGEVQLLELNRREFLEKLAVGAAALAVTGQMAWADEADKLVPPATPQSPWLGRYPLTPRRVYRGKNLEAVGMPLGGIGSGSIWLNGQGQLGVWQIFNNLSEPRVPDSFLAVAAKAASGPAVTRVLQTQGEGSLRPVASIDYEGGYPIARLTFHDAALPVEVALEAMNPMIPLDTANSSIPCALFRLTAKNPGNAPVDVAFCATLQNAVGNPGAERLQGVRLDGYGGNRNRVVRGDAMTVVAMDKAADPVASGPVKVRTAAGKEVPGPELVWLAGLPGLTAQTAEPLARIAAEGGVVLADGAVAGLLRGPRPAPRRPNRLRRRGDGLRGFRRQDLRRLDDRRRGLWQGAFPWDRTRPTTGERFFGPRPGQYLRIRRSPPGHGHLESLSHPAAVHRVSHRRRQQAGENVHQSPRRRQGGSHGNRQGSGSPGARQLGRRRFAGPRSRAGDRRSEFRRLGPYQHRSDHFLRHPTRAAAEPRHVDRSGSQGPGRRLRQGGRGNPARRFVLHDRPHHREGPAGARRGGDGAGAHGGRMDHHPLYAPRRFPLGRAWLPGPGEHAGRRSAGDSRPVGQREHHSGLGPGFALEPGQRTAGRIAAANR